MSTVKQVIEACKLFEKLYADRVTDYLTTEDVWCRLEPLIERVEAKQQQPFSTIQPNANLYGVPLRVFKDDVEMFAEAMVMMRSGRNPQILTLEGSKNEKQA